MRGVRWLVFVMFIFGALVLTACGGGGGGSEDVEVPAPYAGKTNPTAGDQAAADLGQPIYQTNCVSCHGENGKGDNPTGQSLQPPAADLTQGKADDYMYWRIAEGGGFEPFNSSMPAWKDVLTEEEIWNTVTYIRTLE